MTSGESGTVIYGFGESPNNITSPGPTIYLQKGTTYTMTIYNIDPSISHAWEIVPTKAVNSTPLFGAGIDISSYISPGASGSVTFTPDQTGNFYYVCTHDNHIDYGMYGDVVVSEPIAEFYSAMGILVVLLALMVTSAVLVGAKSKNKIGIW